MRDETFVTGMAMLETVFGIKATEAHTAAWHMALSDLTDEQFLAAVKRTIQTTESTYGNFPLPAVILSNVPESDCLLEAHDAWERLLACREYNPELGAYWSAKRVRRELGDAVHTSVLAAGGYGRLERLGDPKELYWMQRLFTDSYKERRGDPNMLPPGPTRAELEDQKHEASHIHYLDDCGDRESAARRRKIEKQPVESTPEAPLLVEATDERKRALIEALSE